MKIAIVGSRGLDCSLLPELLRALPPQVTEIVSGGAVGVDHLARTLACQIGIPLREFLPDYETYGKRAPLLRNRQIIDYADEVLAFWDGRSRGTGHVIAECIRCGKPVRVFPVFSEHNRL